jgi:hypothetical protein
MNTVRKYRPEDDDDRPRRRPATGFRCPYCTREIPIRDRPRRRPATGFRCPYCTREIPIRRSKVTLAGIVLFWLLLFSLIGTLFCWVGLLLRD